MRKLTLHSLFPTFPLEINLGMSSRLRNLFNRYFPFGKAHRVLIGGLESTGKTTLLYLLKFGEVFHYGPTIGFNVEETPVATSSGRHLRIQGWDVGLGGCASIQLAMRMAISYAPFTNAFIWMVDTTDKARLEESAELLRGLLRETDIDLKEAANGRQIPVLM